MFDNKKISKILTTNLKIHLNDHTPDHNIKEVYNYALFPTGKLFRPLICLATIKDFSNLKDGEILNPDSNYAKLLSALEIHHTYTLLHDDLPCMDDDDYRRGKLSTHKKYGQWQSLLVGDGLLNLSYRLLSLMNGANAHDVFKLFSWALGSKGLIHGQILDLDYNKNKPFKEIILIHKLKTARLIQTAIAGGYMLIGQTNLNISINKFTNIKNCLRFSESLGILFQLLDDLTELSDEEIGLHEFEINPWLNYKEQSLSASMKYMDYIFNFNEKYQTNNLKEVIKKYFEKILNIITDQANQNNLNKNKIDEKTLMPIVSALNRFRNL